MKEERLTCCEIQRTVIHSKARVVKNQNALPDMVAPAWNPSALEGRKMATL